MQTNAQEIFERMKKSIDHKEITLFENYFLVHKKKTILKVFFLLDFVMLSFYFWHALSAKCS